MPGDTDLTLTQIEDAIKSTFEAAAPKAIVVPQRVDGIEAGENLDEVRSPADDRRIHAWTFWLSPIARRVPETHDYDIQGSKRTLRCDVTFTYFVKLFYEYRAGSDVLNATREANDYWCTVARYLSARPRFGLTNRNMRQHFELQRSELTLTDARDCKIFAGTGTLDVLVYEHFTVL